MTEGWVNRAKEVFSVAGITALSKYATHNSPRQDFSYNNPTHRERNPWDLSPGL
jgi:hypothetical protein